MMLYCVKCGDPIEKDELIDEEVLGIDDSIQEEPIEPFEDIDQTIALIKQKYNSLRIIKIQTPNKFTCIG